MITVLYCSMITSLLLSSLIIIIIIIQYHHAACSTLSSFFQHNTISHLISFSLDLHCLPRHRAMLCAAWHPHSSVNRSTVDATVEGDAEALTPHLPPPSRSSCFPLESWRGPTLFWGWGTSSSQASFIRYRFGTHFYKAVEVVVGLYDPNLSWRLSHDRTHGDHCRGCNDSFTVLV